MGTRRLFMATSPLAVLLLACTLASLAVAIPPPWAFLNRYPKHYVARRTDSPVVIDGVLDDAAWQDAAWSTGPFNDIKEWLQLTEFNRVPSGYRCRVKLLWDSDYLYIGAELTDPFVDESSATATHEHNKAPAPYSNDNDFEVFIDPSGTGQFYKEYEMSPSNQTYDVLWGVPDRAGLECDEPEGLVPPCQNSTFNTGQSWSMAGDGLALRAATKPTAVNQFGLNGGWVAEIAFPIAGYDLAPDARHGGLLDTGGILAGGLDRRWPLSANSSQPLYWNINFARAQHARKYSDATHPPVWSPPNLPKTVAGSSAGNLTTNNNTECALLDALSPTFLTKYFGSPWGCYWEYAWQGQKYPYMHRPFDWGVLEFRDSKKRHTADEPCFNIRFPARHVALQLYYAQVAWAAAHNGSYADRADVLATTQYCSYMNETAFYKQADGASGATCLLGDLKQALNNANNNVTVHAYRQGRAAFSSKCAREQCFVVHVSLALGSIAGEQVVSTASVDQNMKMQFPTVPGVRGDTRLCLNNIS